MITLTLPYPPSVNRYWRHIAIKGQPRTLISRDGHAYRSAVQAALGRWKPVDARVAVHITAHAPDRRTRDLDNLPKAILDSLTHAGVWLDDGQVDDLRITRGGIVKGGSVVVRIETMGEAA